MKNKALRLIGAGALAAGLMMAQAGPEPGAHGMAGHGMVDRMTRALNLTSDQQAALTQSMTTVRQSSQSLHQQLRTDQEALMTAAKANPEADLSAQSAAVAKDMAQMMAIHAQAYARFYNTLTPAQKQVVDNLGGHMAMFGGMGGGFGGR